MLILWYIVSGYQNINKMCIKNANRIQIAKSAIVSSKNKTREPFNDLFVYSMNYWTKNKSHSTSKQYKLGTIIEHECGLNYNDELSYCHTGLVNRKNGLKDYDTRKKRIWCPPRRYFFPFLPVAAGSAKGFSSSSANASEYSGLYVYAVRRQETV